MHKGQSINYPGIREDGHADKVQRKAQRVQMLEALLEMHEGVSKPDQVYIHELQLKLKIARIQFQHMRP